ncbi:hypothetical protein LR48_Vigan09g085900 [Vigna angularis]|uniref:Uncharacterized protein n=1 Tax=Phaseolus angularis TaxID=3914 RepID=A0A0L9VAV8_PHAAN|nr:hypothetical protein LR48_Vigan09g085900 [Vigna angularis]
MSMLLGLDFTKFPLMYLRVLLYALMLSSLTKSPKRDPSMNKPVLNNQFMQFLAFLTIKCEDQELKTTKTHTLIPEKYYSWEN